MQEKLYGINSSCSPAELAMPEWGLTEGLLGKYEAKYSG